MLSLVNSGESNFSAKVRALGECGGGLNTNFIESSQFLNLFFIFSKYFNLNLVKSVKGLAEVREVAEGGGVDLKFLLPSPLKKNNTE